MTPRKTVVEQQTRDKQLERLAASALDSAPVSGLTHNFYRYPARFAPSFARAAVEAFSQVGDTIADPYMGGGTSVVEGVAAGRHVIGNDLNSLAAFIARAKTTALTANERNAIRDWATNAVPALSYRAPNAMLTGFIDAAKTINLTLDRARFLKKTIAGALATIDELPTVNSQRFAKCAVLRVGQWALDGRKTHTPVTDFRSRLASMTHEMLDAIHSFSLQARRSGGHATILNLDAAVLSQASALQRTKASLVVTSPPYPGVHVLYHRWQVDGRRETPAPYWISGCSDGKGAAFYNFGDRRCTAADDYFRRSLQTLLAIRAVLTEGGHMIQLVAFSRTREQLRRYLENMRAAGFVEVRHSSKRRIWRNVPNRKWHATLGGGTSGAREVVLVHRAE